MGRVQGPGLGLVQLTSVCIPLPRTRAQGHIQLQGGWETGSGRQPCADSPSTTGEGEGRGVQGRGTERKACSRVPAMGGVKLGKPRTSTKYTACHGEKRQGSSPSARGCAMLGQPHAPLLPGQLLFAAPHPPGAQKFSSDLP